MSLKASKTYLLHQRLEVLGYFVTPDGLVMQPDKLEALISKRGAGVCGQEGAMKCPDPHGLL